MTTDDEAGSTRLRSAQAREIFDHAVRRCAALLSFLWQLPWTGIFTRLVGVAAAVWIGTLVVMDIFGQKTSVEPISVPKSLADAGFTPEVAAYRLRSAMYRYAKDAFDRRASGRSVVIAGLQIKPVNISMQTELPKIAVPTVGISLDTITTSLRNFFDTGRRHGISGEFSLKNKLLWLHLRLDGREIYASAEGVDPESPDEELAKAAPKIFEEIQPYVVASAGARQNPQDALATADRIIARLPQSDENVALSYLLKGETLNPKLVEAVYNRGKAYRDKGNLDDAIADFSQAITLDSTDAGAFINRGDA